MWTVRAERLTDAIYRYEILQGERALSFAEVIKLWKSSQAFCEFFAGILRDSPFSCFRWELPALANSVVDRSYQSVLIDSPSIDVPANSGDFASYFHSQPLESVVQFPNLGGDAELVVPTPSAETNNYSHLAAFSRNAPLRQQIALWKQVGSAVENRLSSKRLWLNTAGGGVPWLHVRLDDFPKYYVFTEYSQLPGI